MCWSGRTCASEIYWTADKCAESAEKYAETMWVKSVKTADECAATVEKCADEFLNELWVFIRYKLFYELQTMCWNSRKCAENCMHDCVETAENVLKTAEKCADYCMKCVETAENVLKQQKNVLNKEC